MIQRPFPPFKDMADAFSQVEGPIMRLRKMSKLQKLLADLLEENGTPEFKQEVTAGLVLLTDEIAEETDHLEDLWLHFWNASCGDACPANDGAV